MYSQGLAKSSAISSYGFLQVIKGLIHFDLTSIDKPILEVGPGIGTITRVVLGNCSNDIYCYELNSFCREKLMVIQKQNKNNARNRMCITGNIADLSNINFYKIIIDGPISKKQIRTIVSNSPDLKIVTIENFRLRQRVWVASALYKKRFRQQFVEILHDNRSTCAIFFTNKTVKTLRFHVIFDYLLTLSRLLPKLILHIYLSRGKLLLSSKNLQPTFVRKLPKSRF
jgi:hypothetical protein